MPRIIKFRAWDTEQGRLVSDNVAIAPNNGRFYPWSISSEGITINVSNEGRFELMQFTGLTDKNGKEIWEGDIVKTDIGIHKLPKSMSIQPVVFRNGAFVLGESGVYFWDYAIQMRDDTVEVIGNIYEHSNLLDTAS